MGKVTHISKGTTLNTGYHLIKNWKSMKLMLRDSYRGLYKMSGLTKGILAAGILYIILPFDFDWIPVIGWLDDGVVLLVIIKRLQAETSRYIRAKVMARKGDY